MLPLSPISILKPSHTAWIRLVVRSSLHSPNFSKVWRRVVNCLVYKGIFSPPHCQGPWTIALGNILMHPANGKSMIKIGCIMSLHWFGLKVVAIKGYSSLCQMTCHRPKSANGMCLAIAICQFLATTTRYWSSSKLLPSGTSQHPKCGLQKPIIEGWWSFSPYHLELVDGSFDPVDHSTSQCLSIFNWSGTKNTFPVLMLLQLLRAVLPTVEVIVASSGAPHLVLVSWAWLCKGPHHQQTQSLWCSKSARRLHKVCAQRSPLLFSIWKRGELTAAHICGPALLPWPMLAMGDLHWPTGISLVMSLSHHSSINDSVAFVKHWEHALNWFFWCA